MFRAQPAPLPLSTAPPRLPRRPPPHVLELYKQHVKGIADALLPASLSAFCKVSAQDRQVSSSSAPVNGMATPQR